MNGKQAFLEATNEDHTTREQWLETQAELTRDFSGFGDSADAPRSRLSFCFSFQSLRGFALVVSAEGVIFYASATIADYLGFHQTDVMHQNIYDYIHVDDRQDFRRQLHWAMDPPPAACGQPLLAETGEDAILGRLLRAQEGGASSPTEYSAFLTRCFVCRVRCLLDSTSGFLTMQFQGKLKFLFGQKRKAPSGAALPPRLSLFCVAEPVLLPSVAEMKVKSVLLRVKHRGDISATTDTKGRPDLVFDPEGAAGDGGGEALGGLLSGSLGLREQRDTYMSSCRLETLGPTKHLNWKSSQDSGAKLKLEPSQSDPFSAHTPPHGACLPHPGVQGTIQASSAVAFRNCPGSHPPKHPPGACAGRTSRALQDGHQGQMHPPASCPFPQGSLDNGHPQPGAQCFPPGGYPTEDKLRGVLMPMGALCNPMSLDVPIKMESDSGPEDASDGYSVSPGQVWLGAGDVAKRQLATFPSRMHLKTEPDSRHHLCSPLLGPGMLGAHPRPSRELAPFHPSRCACLGPPARLCVRGHQPPAPGYDGRAPGATPVVKREPLDSPPWAAPSQGGAPGMFPGSALATRKPPRDSMCAFLP
ncbi:aryl hydrocarbon receptor repressor-like protein [Camelus ferus]|nr:aryl hydrocarbon receptor repressor-like protein [Camelus ferus]